MKGRTCNKPPDQYATREQWLHCRTSDFHLMNWITSHPHRVKSLIRVNLREKTISDCAWLFCKRCEKHVQQKHQTTPRWSLTWQNKSYTLCLHIRLWKRHCSADGHRDVVKQHSEMLKQDFIDLLNTVSALNADVFISGPHHHHPQQLLPVRIDSLHRRVAILFNDSNARSC